MADVYRVVVKNGSTDYQFNDKTHSYESKTVDYVDEFTTLAAALGEFCYQIDEDPEFKVTLSFIPSKSKK